MISENDVSYVSHAECDALLTWVENLEIRELKALKAIWDDAHGNISKATYPRSIEKEEND